MKIKLISSIAIISALFLGCGSGSSGGGETGSTSSAGNNSSATEDTSSSTGNNSSVDNSNFGDSKAFSSNLSSVIIDCYNPDDKSSVLRLTFSGNSIIGDSSNSVMMNGDYQINEVTNSDSIGMYMYEYDKSINGLKLFPNPDFMFDGYFGKKEFSITSANGAFTPGSDILVDSNLCTVTHVLVPPSF